MRVDVDVPTQKIAGEHGVGVRQLADRVRFDMPVAIQEICRGVIIVAETNLAIGASPPQVCHVVGSVPIDEELDRRAVVVILVVKQ
jgi:hypothetical protein